MTVRILQGDCRYVLKTLPSESVHCVVTSPPYWGLRDYGTARWSGGDPTCDHTTTRRGHGDEKQASSGGTSRDSLAGLKECRRCGAIRVDRQIGLEARFTDYVAEMVAVFREVRRVLRADGTVFLNLGDSYATGGPRQTGRNDTDRETPGGRGGSFRGGVRRAIACDTGGKGPVDSPAHDCFCRSLCGACREAYRIGRVHSGRLPASTPPVSNSASSRERMGLPFGHVPMSGSTAPDGRSGGATRGQQRVPTLAAERTPASQASTRPVSSQPRQEGLPQSGQPSECRLCGCSLPDCVPASAHMEACICGTEAGASADRTIGMDALGSAYLDYTRASLKPKDLCGIPWRVAFALQADGWWLRQDIIWSKPNPMPESVTDRCTKAHEYLFLLSKSERYFYDAEAIKEPLSGPVHAPGNRDPGKIQGTKEHQGGNSQFRDSTERSWGSELGRNRRSVWEIATSPFPEAHFATFPPALIEPCVCAGCPKGGTVLDPFGGAGTTGLVADRLGRNAVLIELSPEYAAMAERRIGGDVPLFSKAELSKPAEQMSMWGGK